MSLSHQRLSFVGVNERILCPKTHLLLIKLGGGHFDNLKLVYFKSPSRRVTARSVTICGRTLEVNKMQFLQKL